MIYPIDEHIFGCGNEPHQLQLGEPEIEKYHQIQWFRYKPRTWGGWKSDIHLEIGTQPNESS